MPTIWEKNYSLAFINFSLHVLSLLLEFKITIPFSVLMFLELHATYMI